MEVVPLAIPDVLLIKSRVFKDSRGFFQERYQAQRYAAIGIPQQMVQDNHSGSHQGVLRGLHYQVQRPQGKLIEVQTGEVFDVAVDLRRSAATFGRWVGTLLQAEAREQLWVPPGFAHGFYVVSAWAEIAYKVSDYYHPQLERTLRWDDPTLGIQWPLAAGTQPLLSSKDAGGDFFKDAEVFD